MLVESGVSGQREWTSMKHWAFARSDLQETTAWTASWISCQIAWKLRPSHTYQFHIHTSIQTGSGFVMYLSGFVHSFGEMQRRYKGHWTKLGTTKARKMTFKEKYHEITAVMVMWMFLEYTCLNTFVITCSNKTIWIISITLDGYTEYPCVQCFSNVYGAKKKQ